MPLLVCVKVLDTEEVEAAQRGIIYYSSCLEPLGYSCPMLRHSMTVAAWTYPISEPNLGYDDAVFGQDGCEAESSDS
jgi:hypothetical protein